MIKSVSINNWHAILGGMACKSVVAALLSVGLCGSNAQAVDSPADVWIGLSDTGSISLTPQQAAGFPFPPPPLDFPDLPLGTSGSTFDIQILDLSLTSSSTMPMLVSDPQPTGEFQVDMFFDLDSHVTASVNGGDPQEVPGSFPNLHTQMIVTPLEPRDTSIGLEQVFEIDVVQMDLVGPITPAPGLNLSFQLLPPQVSLTDGHVTVLKSPAPGGGDIFQVDTALNLFINLSINDSPPILPDQTGPLHLESHNSVVPEPSTLLLGVLAAGGLWMCRRS